jgi:hypothetical protein
MWDGSKASLERSTSPITAYVGANGSGKSLLAVQDSVAALLAGRRVVSTARLVDPEGGACDDESCTGWAGHPDHGRAHPLWTPLLRWDDLLQAEHCDVLMDEVTGVASARESSSLPAAVADVLVQLRRRDVRLRWTAPAWARADLVLRECTQAVVLCTGLVRRRVEGQLWPRSRWVWSRMVDARDLDELTQAQRQGTARVQPRVIVRSLQRVGATDARRWYDSLDSVASLSQSVSRGTCLVCGGRRVQPRCECGEGAAAPDRARRVVDAAPGHPAG